MEPLADKKKMILESSLKLIKDHGFHGCPMSLVAKNAGVAAGTIYTYFESKDELIIELYHYVKNRLYSEISTKDNPALDYKQRFFNLWNGLTALYIAHPEIQGFFEQFKSSPYNTDEVQKHECEWHVWVHAFFQEGIDKGHLRNLLPDVLVIMVLGSIASVAKVKVSYKTKLTRKGVDLDQITGMVWDGIKRQTP